MLSNKSLKAKILFGFMLMSFGLGVVTITGHHALDSVVSTYKRLATVSVPNLGHISGLRARGRQIHSELIKLALYHDHAEESKKTLSSLNKALTRYDEITKEKLAEPFIPGEEQVFRNVDVKYEPVRKSADFVINQFHSNDPEKIEKIKNELLAFEDHVRAHQEALLTLDDFHVERGQRWSKESEELSSRMTIVLFSIAILTLIIALTFAFAITKGINNVLRGVTSMLTTSSEKVASNSRQVAQASQYLSEGTTEQAEALHETVTSTNEIAAMTEKTSDNAKETLKRAEFSRNASEKGKNSIENMVVAITEIGSSNNAINDQIKKGNEGIQEIVDLIVDIGNKTKLIDDIVFQTKLLSFNVSVEAARAGEHGKGFAVVAEEMSNLADMSGRASKEISSMLTQTTQKAMSVVEGNRNSVNRLITIGDEKVSAGKQVAHTCKDVLDEIIHYVDEMCNMIKETTHSTQEQAKGVSEINKAMGQIDEITAQNAHSSKECSEAAAHLMSEVEKTRTIIKELNDVIHGKNSSFEQTEVPIELTSETKKMVA